MKLLMNGVSKFAILGVDQNCWMVFFDFIGRSIFMEKQKDSSKSTGQVELRPGKKQWESLTTQLGDKTNDLLANWEGGVSDHARSFGDRRRQEEGFDGLSRKQRTEFMEWIRTEARDIDPSDKEWTHLVDQANEAMSKSTY
jgi:hypothetical protein